MTSNESVKPDGVYDSDGNPTRSMPPALREGLMAVPNLAKLIYRLMRDDRVPARSKAALGAVMVYAISPIDLIPEGLMPVLGPIAAADDLLLMAYALNRIIRTAGPSVVNEHWEGNQEVLSLIESVTEFGVNFVPAPVRRALERIAG